jgi:hypothetical protein
VPARIWLDVPFSEKDAAKAAGARWDAAARRWYAPRAGMTQLTGWAAAEPVPELLPGEDRSFGSGLFVDLVPSSCWFTNARSCISERDWERVRRMVTERAGRRCEVCRATADRDAGRWLEVHERWSYDDAARVQSLRRLICLCTPCHTATHLGLASLRGVDGPAREHLASVSGLTTADVELLVEGAFELWAQRSRFTWALDLSMLTDAGVRVVRRSRTADHSP